MSYIKLRHIINENVNQAKAILKKHKIPESDKKFLDLRKWLKGKEGYLGWFTKMAFVNKVRFDELGGLVAVMEREPEVIKALPKQLIQYDKDLEELLDDLTDTRQRIYGKRFWNEFPSLQKNLLPFKGISDDDLYTLFQMYKNKDKDNFIKKISRYKTREKLVKAMVNFYQGRTTRGFENVMNQVKSSKAKIVHSSESDDIIITEVNYKQCNTLGSGTSWCLIGSKGTFDSYTSGADRQYIIFLTDESGNYSKIGVTYGFVYRTAHLKNDSHLNENKLKELLNDRNVSVDVLKRDKQEYIDSGDINKTAVVQLRGWRFTTEEILKNKNRFRPKEIEEFTEEQIEEYDLLNKTEIDERIYRKFLEKGMGSDWVMTNKDRFVFEMGIEDVLRLSPVPKDFDKLVKSKLLSDNAKEWAKGIQMASKNPLTNSYTFGKYYIKDHRGNRDSRDSLESLIYGYKYSQVHSGNYSLEEVLDETTIPYNTHATELSDWVDFLKGAGWTEIDKDADLMLKIVSPFMGSGYAGTKTHDIIKTLDDYPILKEPTRKVIEKDIEKSKYFDSDLEIIDKFYPDIAEKVRHYNKLNKYYAYFSEMIPNAQYMNMGVNRWRNKYGNRQSGIIKPDNPSGYYDIFYETLKDWKWGSGWSGDNEFVYWVLVLVKSGNVAKIKEMKTRWGYNIVGKVIRAAYGTWDRSGSNRIYEDFNLNEEERERLFEQLMTVDIQTNNTSEPDPEEYDMIRHRTLSLIYYLNNWGFDRYKERVKQLRNNWDSYQFTNQPKDEIKDGYYTKKGGKTMRLGEFKHIISHLTNTGKWDEIRDLIQEVLDWKLLKTELKRTLSWIKNFSDFHYKRRNEYKEEIVNHEWDLSAYE